MLVTLGDLVEDVVVRLQQPINVASDTESLVERRRGGSAANLAMAAARAGHEVRFIGQVGNDVTGQALIDELGDAGVDTTFIARQGSTSTIIVMVSQDGERTFLTDRRTCRDLVNPTQAWLGGATALHVPFYSLAEPPMADTAMTVLKWANEAGVLTSIDASSVGALEAFGVEAARQRILDLNPDVVFANADEAEVLGLDQAMGGSITVRKDGPRPVTILRAGSEPVTVALDPVPGVVDTTGAGDAFAAGFLAQLLEVNDGERHSALMVAVLVDAARRGHRYAAEVIGRGGDQGLA